MSLPSTDPAAVQVYAEEYQRLRQVDHASVQQVYWQHRQSTKMGPPTPLDSAAGTPMGDLPRGGEASGSDQTTPQDIPPTLVHPFTVDDGAATQITAGLMGVDINQPQRVEEWLRAPVTTTQDVMKILRCYHKGVIRRELYNMVLQVETALRTVDDRVFQVKRELSWMASDNRQQQKNQSAPGSPQWFSGGAFPSTTPVYDWLDAQAGPRDPELFEEQGLCRRPNRRGSGTIFQRSPQQAGYSATGRVLVHNDLDYIQGVDGATGFHVAFCWAKWSSALHGRDHTAPWLAHRVQPVLATVAKEVGGSDPGDPFGHQQAPGFC